MKKLFLDDLRIPKDAIGLVPDNMNRFYWESDWSVVRSYEEFCGWIKENGLPDFVSFDHDLADEHYGGDGEGYVEKTGYECAKWLVDYCVENGFALPDYMVHSANPVGKKNISSYLENAKKHLL